jgi:predicted DsbA family dithiol-disulfide isomerase
VDIQVWSDVVCPWCYLGKRRLEKALAGFPEDVTITYRAYQLDPSPVPEAIRTKDAMAEKFGGRERAEEMFANVAAIAAGDGLILDFDQAIAANTFDAHRLIAFAGQEHHIAMVEALHRAHFTDGIDIGSRKALSSIAAAVGLDEVAALAFLESDAGREEVRHDIDLARELGIQSVPTFVVNGRYGISGAQDAEVLRDALDRIAATPDA